jgi:branched-chain amino acid aminotransferase
MSLRSDFIWMDGALVPFDEANIHVLSHTLHYGLGVFEGIRAYAQTGGGGGGVFKLDSHLRRLYDSAKMCQIKIPFPIEQLHAACLETLRGEQAR